MLFHLEGRRGLRPIRVMGVGVLVALLASFVSVAAPTTAGASGATAPGAPTAVVAVPMDHLANVWFTAPASDGGSAITSYTVTATDSTTPVNGGQTCTATDATRGCTIAGLTNADSYTFAVVATNAIGSSSASNSSSAVTPAAVTISQLGQASGSRHFCMVLSNSTVECWGKNVYGQLGDGTNSSRSGAGLVRGVGGVGLLTGVSAVATGQEHTCAVLTAGGAVCWGNNTSGELGDGTTTDRTLPVAVLGAGGSGTLSGVVSIAGGWYQTCAALSGGAAYCWGSNTYGQLGDGTTTDRWTPTAVVGVYEAGTLSGIASFALTNVHSCARSTAGGVFCWGSNSYAQLGDGMTFESHSPVAVVGTDGTGTLSNVSEIAVGSAHGCALLDSGAVDCWGYQNWGQVGSGTTASTSLYRPTAVLGVGGSGTLAGISGLAGGSSFTCARSSGGGAFCWGQGTYGQLGNNASSNTNVPSNVVGVGGSGTLSGITAISTGEADTCAVVSPSQVDCWGAGTSGALGDGSTANRSTPGPTAAVVPPAPTISGAGHNSATLSWTAAAVSILTTVTATDLTTAGNGGQTCSSSIPTCTVTGLTDGDSYSFTVTTYSGRLTSTSSPSSSSVTLAVASKPANVGAVAYDHSALIYFTPSSGWTATATAADSTTTANGGQTASSATSPILVEGLTDGDSYTFTLTVTNAFGTSTASDATATIVPGAVSVTQVAGSPGSTSTCALLSNTSVVCWGSNSNGQLGDGTTTARSTPVQVLGVGGSGVLTGVSSLALGFTHSCAVLTSSGVVCWGSNTGGQLGDAKTTARSTPAPVVGVGGSGTLSGVSSMSAGTSFSCAALTSGGVDCWGVDSSGQLGDNGSAASSTPVRVLGVGASGTLSGVSSISSGSSHTCALLGSGGVDCWGINTSSQLGDNSTTTRKSPVVVLGVGASGTLSGVSSISSGSSHTCALLSGGAVDCWGYNNNGQLGDNTTTIRKVPVAVLGVDASGTLSGVSSIGAGGTATCALMSGGGVDCWGSNGGGQLGDGTTTARRTTPAPVVGVDATGTLSGVAKIAVQSTSSCGALVAGGLYCWGGNASGQVGDGSTTNRTSPVAVISPVPTSPAVTSTGSGTATVSWSAATGALRYTVTATDTTNAGHGGQVCRSAGSSCTISGLAGGDNYTFAVTSYNGVATSAASVSTASVSIVAAPGAPTSLVATPGDGSVSVAFTAGADGGASITNYEYQLNGSGSWYAFSPAVTSSPVSISVTNGVTYTVKLRAVNSAGSGTESVSSESFTPAAAPSAPTAPSDLRVVPGDRSAEVSFTAGSLGGGTLERYEYTINEGAAWLPVSSGSSSPVSVTGLPNGECLSLRLRAVTSVGASDASSAVPVCASGSGVAWTAGAAAEANSWESVAAGAGVFVAVSSDGTHRVMSSSDGVTWTAGDAAEANAWRSVVDASGRFVAVSSDGDHRVMTSDDGLVWTARTAAADSAWASVTFGDGVFVAVADGGEHRVMTSTDGVTWVAGDLPEANAWTSVTFGDGVFVAVAADGDDRVATSADGGSTWTSQSAASASPWRSVTADDSIGTFAAVASDGAVMTSTDGVSWTSASTPESLGLQSIASCGGSLIAVANANDPSAAASHRVLTSTDGVAWFVREAVGASSYSAVVCDNGVAVAVSSDGADAAQVMTSGSFVLPLAPTSLVASPGDRSVTIEFESGADRVADSPVATRYMYELNGTGVWHSMPFGEASSSVTITRLVNGTTYSIRLRAVSPSGRGAISAPVTAVPRGVPSRPGRPVITGRGGGWITARTSAPVSDGSAAITEYRLRAYDTAIGGAPVATCTTLSVEDLSCRFSDLTNGKAYWFDAVATNVAGDSAPSARSVAARPPGVPGTPMYVAGGSGPQLGTYSVNWGAADSNGSPVNRYRAVAIDPMLGVPIAGRACQASGRSSSCTIRGLTPGATYRFAVTATNVIGTGGSATSDLIIMIG